MNESADLIDVMPAIGRKKNSIGLTFFSRCFGQIYFIRTPCTEMLAPFIDLSLSNIFGLVTLVSLPSLSDEMGVSVLAAVLVGFVSDVSMALCL